MSTTAVKIVLDTNILISIIGRKSPLRWMFDAIINGQIVLCVSNEIILEYKEILQQKNGPEVAKNMIAFFAIHLFVEKYDPFFKFRLITQDDDDNKFVDCAIASNAHAIISNDKHFDELKNVTFPKVHILSLTEFKNQFFKNS